MNFSQEELDKFSKMSAHWWDESGDLRTLHQINPIRLAYIQEKISLAGKRVLDVGCGGGILTEALAKSHAEATGIDLNDSLIRVAKLHLLESQLSINYLKTSVESLAETEPQSYDVVTCLELLEHVPDPKAIIKACATLLKPQGHLFVSTINRNIKAYLMAIIGAEYILNLLPRNTHDYAKFIRPSELSGWGRDANLSLKEIMGIHYNPLNKQFSLSKDISVNYIWYAVKN